MTRRVPPSECTAFAPGHQIHYIQARLAREDDANPKRAARVVAVHGDGWFDIVVDGTTHRVWHHHPDVVAVYCEPGTTGTVQLRWGILVMGRYLCIAKAGHEITRCVGRYCEICGGHANILARDSWDTCTAHVDVPRPDRPRYDHLTGEPLAPDAEDPKGWRRAIQDLDEQLYPIDHLDFPTPRGNDDE